MSQRTNFVKVTNLPPNYSNGQELFDFFSQVGQVQDITAVDPTTIIVSFAMRSQADSAVFALNNVTISGSNVNIVKYFPQQDPQYFSNPVYQRLGQYIGQDHHVMQPHNFKPWSSAHPSGGNFNNFSSTSAASFSVNVGASSSGYQQNTRNGGTGDLISDNTQPWSGPGQSDNDECNICLCDHDNTSLTLVKCHHSYHKACLEALIKNSSNTYIECPYCKTVYGIRTGNMPTTGSISHRLHPLTLPGFENCSSGCIEILFQFQSGIQGPEHPNPGQPYTAYGFPRKGYLPDTKEGEMMLHGIYMAWNQRLMFTVGTSLSNRMSNVITWNDIHIKTHPHGGEHGFPDPNYMKNLSDDLKVRGITEAAILDHISKHPYLRTNGKMS